MQLPVRMLRRGRVTNVSARVPNKRSMVCRTQPILQLQLSVTPTRRWLLPVTELQVLRFLLIGGSQVQMMTFPLELFFCQSEACLLRAYRHVVVIELDHSTGSRPGRLVGISPIILPSALNRLLPNPRWKHRSLARPVRDILSRNRIAAEKDRCDELPLYPLAVCRRGR